MSGPRFTNRLIDEKSPYLLQHAHNPVDWFPWGDEAFAKARQENKPIFLSVGYSTCHWCHVMERESFENPAIAALLNESFVSVKVDREERPDIDRVYMMFVQSTTGSGGWPMSVFLDPRLKPFLGGTYYPPEDRYGRPGFGSLLRRLAEIWKESPEKVLGQSEHFVTALESHLTKSSPPGERTLRPEWLDQACRQFGAGFDPEEGGFSPAPKFPRPSVFLFLFRYWRRSGKAQALDMALFTLRKMADGGMRDHLGGGFHRYSVDGRWHVPHFEKMLYDQAQLAAVYLEAFQITGEDAYAAVSRSTLDYVLRDLQSSEGGFFSAEDADSLPEAGALEKTEGAFYVWTREEIDARLTPEEALAFRRTYGVEEAGNVLEASDPHGELTGQNVLYRQTEPEIVGKLVGESEEGVNALLAAASEKLRAARAERPRPHLDDKIVVAWNGLMISALARGYQVLGDKQYLTAAQRAARFIRTRLFEQERLHRSFRQGISRAEGFAEDYACLIQGLLDLYEADFAMEWLQWAGELQRTMSALFEDPAGGFFSTAADAPDVLFRMRDDHDGAEPAANSVAALNLIRLGRMLDQTEWQEAARKLLQSFVEILEARPSALPALLAGVIAWLNPPEQAVIAAREPEGAEAQAHLRVLRREFAPDRAVLLADGGPAQAWLAQRIEVIAAMQANEQGASVYLCRNYTCELAITDPAELARRLAATRPAPI